MISENNLVFKELRVNTIMENRFLIGNLFKIMAKIWPSLFALSFVVRLEKNYLMKIESSYKTSPVKGFILC